MGFLDSLFSDSGSGPGAGWLGPMLQAQPGPSRGFSDQPQSAAAGSAMANAAPALANAAPGLASGAAAAPANPFATLFGNASPTSPSAATPGIGDRLGAAFMNLANSRGFLPALAGAASGLATGQRNDLASLLQAQQGAAAQALARAGVPPALAQAAALNPALLQAIAPHLARQSTPVPSASAPAAPASAAPASSSQPSAEELWA